MIIHTLVYRNTFASASHYGWFWTFLSLYYLYAKPVEMSCFTIQIIITPMVQVSKCFVKNMKIDEYLP